jgi:Immunoglobulin domain
LTCATAVKSNQTVNGKVSFHWTKVDEAAFSQNGRNIVLRKVQLKDSGTYVCTVFQQNGRQTSANVTVTVIATQKRVHSERARKIDGLMMIEMDNKA